MRDAGFLDGRGRLNYGHSKVSPKWPCAVLEELWH